MKEEREGDCEEEAEEEDEEEEEEEEEETRVSLSRRTCRSGRAPWRRMPPDRSRLERSRGGCWGWRGSRLRACCRFRAGRLTAPSASQRRRSCQP